MIALAGLEILSRLTVSAVNVENVSYGGKPELTRTEVAALLVGATKPVEYLGYAKYILDYSRIYLLANHVYVWAAGVAAEEGWRITSGQPIVRKISWLVVSETIDPNTCIRCHGNGCLASRTCTHCHGSGQKSISDAERARFIGVSRQTYRQCWRYKYLDVYNYVQDLEFELRKIIQKNS